MNTLQHAAAIAAIAGVSLGALGDITVVSRTSKIAFDVFAESGPDVDRFHLVPDLEEASTSAPFDHVHAYDAFVFRGEEPASGSASASGVSTRAESLVLGANGLVQVSSAGTAQMQLDHLSGAGGAFSAINHNLFIEFEVTGDPVNYRIEGDFLPDGDDLAQIKLRAGLINTLFQRSTIFGDSGPFSQTGTLEPGVYQLIVDFLNSGLVNEFTDPSHTRSGSYSLTFTILCPADLAEPVGVLDFSDVIAFLTAFAGGEPAADLAAPTGVFDFSDIIAFLSAFGAGCP